MPLEDLERAVRAEKGFPVHFTDVAPAADLHRILQVHPVDHFSYWLLVQLMSCCHHCGICGICRRKSANNLTGLGERCCASWSTTSAFGLLCVCCHGSTCCIRKTVCLVVGISPLFVHRTRWGCCGHHMLPAPLFSFKTEVDACWFWIVESSAEVWMLPADKCCVLILQRWEGQFVLSGPHADGSAAARFSRPEGAKEVQTYILH